MNTMVTRSLLHSGVWRISHMPAANSGGAYNDTILQSLFLDKGLKNTLSKRGTANISKTYKADFNS
jgi:hypothetical protein